MDKRIPQKIQFLKFIAEQGVVSAQDINRYFFNPSTSLGVDKTDVIISTLYQLGVSRMWYGSIPGGIWKISDPKLYKLLKIYYPDLWDLKVSRMTGTNLVPHYLEMNHIRTVFEKSGHFEVALWLSERLIRAIPAKQRSDICPERVPDAVFWVMKKEGGQKKYFLECERHFNSTDERYRDIFESYFWRKDAEDHNVIFLCGNKKIQRRLISIQSKMFLSSNSFQFLTLEGFYKNYEQAVVEPEANVEPMAAV